MRILTLSLVLVLGWAAACAAQGDVVEEWAKVQAPPPPEVQAVSVDVKTTALLVLDLEHKTCNAERRPRCVASIPRVARFLSKARNAGVYVAHSVVPGADALDILPELAPRLGEPVVSSGVDKFFRTELESALAAKGIRTVIVVGTAANGAVLHTATGAALRGLKVIVPVDGLSGDLYAEQYTCWHMLNAPGTRNAATLTSLDRISF